jgi:hypothetical protein
LQAFDAFKADVRIPWQAMTGNVPKVQHRIWVDALKENADAPSADPGAAFIIAAIYA